MNVAVKEKLQNQKGFTIIEVVLVLAIAGLIFLMVFIALPALQSSQRDTARKNDVSAVASGVTSYTGNNRGTFPDSTAISSYVQNVSDNTDKSKISVAKAATGTQSVAPADSEIVVTPSSKCGTVNTSSASISKGTSRQFTVVTKLEAGNGTYYCLDS